MYTGERSDGNSTRETSSIEGTLQLSGSFFSPPWLFHSKPVSPLPRPVSDTLDMALNGVACVGRAVILSHRTVALKNITCQPLVPAARKYCPHSPNATFVVAVNGVPVPGRR